MHRDCNRKDILKDDSAEGWRNVHSLEMLAFSVYEIPKISHE